MALTKAKGRQTTSVGAVSEGADVYLKALRDGTLTMADWTAALSLEGRIFTANVGSATTPATFGSGGLDTAEFDLHIAVPASVVIIPLSLLITMEAYGTILLFEACLISGKGSTCGAGTAITPVSSNTNAGITSACTVTSVATATSGVYMTTEVKEIWRANIQGISLTKATNSGGQAALPDTFFWRAKDDGILDVVGPSAQLAVFAASQAGTGMIILKYAELPYSTRIA